jgi:DNA repair protein RadD
MVITLRPDQIEDVDHVRDALRRTRRVLLCRPCGTGKTVIFCAITERVATLSGARTLILQHRDELIGQTAATLTAMAVRYGVIAAGYPASSATVQIASINTITRRLERYRPDDFRLLFIDEAHHAAAPTWQRVIDYFAEAYAIGCSASPLRLDGGGLDRLFDELVVTRTVKDYVALGVLAPAVTFAPAQPPDLSGIRIRAGDYEQEALADRMADSAITGDAVEHYKKLSPQLPGLVYCCSIAHSQQVCAAFTAAGYAVRHVDGETPAAERERTIADLRAGKLDLATNVALFTEGLDIPVLGVVIVLRPTQSLALHLQMCGRALRVAPGKRRGLILDHAGNSLKHGLYDFGHEWSLQGRPKKSTEPLVRQCPECGALLPVRAETCSECGYRFVVQLQPPRLPNTVKGELERVADDGVSAAQLRAMSYPRLLAWCEDNPLRLERARRARGYAKGWKYHTAMAWRSAQRGMQGGG